LAIVKISCKDKLW